MKIEATAKQIRTLLELVELDARAAASTLDDEEQHVAQRRLPKPLFDRYLSVVRAGRVPPVVAIQSGSCSGCHLRLPTMVEYRARHSPAIHICPHCGRLLYASEFATEGARERPLDKNTHPRVSRAAPGEPSPTK